MNYYVWSTINDPADELSWLNKTLTTIEAKNEIAIVIAHIPPGSSSCFYNWAIRYRAITDRF